MAAKIKIKRGLKVNLPNLDIGELAFCIDTKELFIGTNIGNQTVNNGENSTHEHLLSDLMDIDTTNKTNGYVVTYDSSVDKYVLKPVPEGTGSGVISLDGLSDVDVTTSIPLDGDVLKYEGGLWKPNSNGGGSSGDSYILELSRWGITQGLPTKGIEVIGGIDINCYSDEAYLNAYNNIVGINSALEWAYTNGYTQVKMPLGEYAVCYAKISDNDREQSIVIDFDYFTFDMSGSTFKIIFDSEKRSPYDKILSGGNWVVNTAPIYMFAGKFLVVRDCNYSCVKNGTVIGDKIDRSFIIQEEKAVEHSYGLCSGGNCSHILIENIDVGFFMGDGLTGSVGLNNTAVRVGYQMGWAIGSLDDAGQPVASTTKCVSGFITVDPSTPHFLQGYGYTQGLTYLQNKKYKIYCYDINQNFITKKDAYVLREFITTKNTKYIKFVVEESVVNGDGWSMTLYEGIYGSYIVYKNNYIHHNHRGGMTIGVNDMYIINNHFYNNGDYPDYDNGLPGFEQPSGNAYMTRYHINMEDSQGFNINIIGNTFDGGRLGIAVRGWDYVIQNNYFKNTGVSLYKLRHLVLSDNYFDNGGIDSYPYNEGETYRHWKIQNNTIDGHIAISGTAPLDEVTGNTIFGNCTFDGRVTSFKNNAFEVNKSNPIVTLTSVGLIDSCSFIKSSTSTVLNSISFGNVVLDNCVFEHIKIYTNNTTILNSKFKNSSISISNNLKLNNCTVNHGDYTLLNMYSYSGNSAFLQTLDTSIISDIEIINCNITSNSPNQVIHCALKNFLNNINIKIENSKIVKQLNTVLGFEHVKGTLTLINNEISSDVVISEYNPNPNIIHTFVDNKLTNVSFNIKSGDITGTKYNYSMKGSTYPTSGFYSSGQLIYNNNPVLGGTIGWICITSGIANDSTWVVRKSYTLGDKIYNGSNIYEVSTSGYSLLTPPTFPTTSGATIVEDITTLPVWQANTSYGSSSIVRPTTSNGFAYICTKIGISGSTEPIFTSSGITDGGTTWSPVPPVVWKEIGIKAMFARFGLIEN